MQAEIFIGGPTASGKSELALLLAERIGGEIISVDSMQVYKGLDIGTAKPSAADQKRVRHHLVDVVDLDQHFNAAQFVTLARQAVADIRSRNQLPIFCGGTGFYFKAYLEGLGESPPASAAMRAELEAVPLDELTEELKRTDPETYKTIDLQNPRRVIRAIEVIRLTGTPYSKQRAHWTPGTDASLAGLKRQPEDLRARIDERVDWMFAHGLVEETQKLLREGLAHNKTALQAIGYRQVVEYIQGIRSLEDTIDLVKTKTRQFAKRQMTWFRHQLPLNWIEMGPSEALQKALENPVIKRFLR